MDSTLLGQFKAEYLGSMPVRTKGEELSTAREAISDIKLLKLNPRPVLITTSLSAVSVLDSESKDILARFPLRQISNVSVDPKIRSQLSFFSTNAEERLHICHCFSVKPKDAPAISNSIEAGYNWSLKGMEAPSTQEHKFIKRKLSRKSSKDKLAATPVSQPQRNGKRFGRFEALYLGSTFIEGKGNKAVQAAAVRLRQKMSEPKPAEISVFERYVEVLDLASDVVVVRVPTLSLMEFELNDDHTLFTFVVDGAGGADRTCSAAIMKPVIPGDENIEDSLKLAKKSAKESIKEEKKAAKKNKGKPAPKTPEEVATSTLDDDVEQETGRIAAVLGARYIGGSGIKSIKTPQHEAVPDAFAALVEKEDRAVVMQFGSEGLRVFDSLTLEAVVGAVVKDIMWSFPFDRNDPANEATEANSMGIAIFNQSLGAAHCEMFEVGEKSVEKVQDAVKQAFTFFMNEQKEQGKDPFLAKGPRIPSPGELFKKQIHRQDLKAVMPIGAGQFGQVYLANQVKGSTEIKRAVKVLRGRATMAMRAEFVREAEIMLNMDHPNLVSLIGVAVQQRPWLIVLEYLEYGDLRNLLLECQRREVRFSEAEMKHLAVQVLEGMMYLENMRMLHMDLAARNCLVGPNNILKVADFGLTHALPNDCETIQGDAGHKLPIRWCAPEVLQNRTFSLSSDVWSCGVTLWEIASYGALPYTGRQNHTIYRYLKNGGTLDAPDGCPGFFMKLIYHMTSFDPSERPRFADAKDILEASQPAGVVRPDIAHAVTKQVDVADAAVPATAVTPKQEVAENNDNASDDGPSEESKIEQLAEKGEKSDEVKVADDETAIEDEQNNKTDENAAVFGFDEPAEPEEKKEVNGGKDDSELSEVEKMFAAAKLRREAAAAESK